MGDRNKIANHHVSINTTLRWEQRERELWNMFKNKLHRTYSNNYIMSNPHE